MAKAVRLRVWKGQEEHREDSAQVENVGVGSASAHFLIHFPFPNAGIECPRGARNLPGLVQEGEPFSEEATLFTKELVLQREVGRLLAASCVGGAQSCSGASVSCHVRDESVAFSYVQPCRP